jgi:nucleotide-binding universal stress UspA family protein
MYKRILVPLDGSAFAEHALPAAIAIARLTNAALHIVRVHEPVSATYASRGRSDEVERRHELEYLHAVAARAIAAGTSAVVTTLVEGWPSSAIEREIARTGVDLVVITDRGRTGLATRCLGTVPDNLVRQAHVPVLIMRASERAVDFEHGVLFRNILIAIEDADADVGVAEAAAMLGSVAGARYTLFEAVRPAIAPVRAYAYAAAATKLDAGTTRARVSSTRDELAAIASRMRDRTRPNGIDIEIGIDTHPASSLLDAMADGRVDLVAMSNRACVPSRMTTRSAVEQVACSSALPMLICPASTPDDRPV